jgi:acetylornithine deacetylase/succinyl-diaminopimelate desuccinylase-like protein
MKRILISLILSLPVVLSQSPDTCSFTWPTILSANLTQSSIPSFSSFGTPETFQAPSADLVSILSQIDPARINKTITTLVSFGTRSTLSDKISNATHGIGGARDWIAKEMRSYIASSGGKLSVTVPSYIQQPASRIPVATNISDVVATLTGSTDPGRIYVISGHYDSRVTDVEDFTSNAPGANDDASGVAVMLESVRVMSLLAGQGKGPKATCIFIAVAGEEQGLYGSTFFANTLKTQKADVQGIL